MIGVFIEFIQWIPYFLIIHKHIVEKPQAMRVSTFNNELK